MRSKGNQFQIRLFAAAALGIGSSPSLAFSDANWTVLGSGMNDSVYAVAVSGSNVYAGGRFTMAGGTPVGFIAKWDGSSWSPLGSGMNNYVRALAVSGTNLYTGGEFTTAGGSSAYHIAKWNGSNWSALGSGSFNGVGNQYPYCCGVYALAISGSNVYAGGSFGTAGFAAVHGIAKWNGISWSDVGSGTSGYSPSPDVLALAVSGSDLYVGGDFTQVGGYLSVNHIAKWNGSVWTALGSGMGGGSVSVYALAPSGANVYAGGLFLSAGNNAAASIARWNGSSWSSLGLGMYVSTNYYPSVHALAMRGINLYAGGDFTHAGGSTTNRTPANRIAKWDGSSWLALGSGMNNNVRALAISGSDLYVGGEFTTAGGKVAGYVARAYLPDLPALSLMHSNTNVVASWPAPDTTGFALEQTVAANPQASWVPNSASITDDGTNKFVTLPATNNSQFFRLRRP